jgi:hypothetical protein
MLKSYDKMEVRRRGIRIGLGNRISQRFYTILCTLAYVKSKGVSRLGHMQLAVTQNGKQRRIFRSLTKNRDVRKSEYRSVFSFLSLL